MFEKLEDVEKRFEEVSKKISDPEVIARQSEWQKLMKEHAAMVDVVEKYREYKKANKDLEQAKEMLNDKELKELAEMEIEEIKEKLDDLYELAKKKATPVVEGAVEDLRNSAIKVTKEVLTKLEKVEK